MRIAEKRAYKMASELVSGLTQNERNELCQILNIDGDGYDLVYFYRDFFREGRGFILKGPPCARKLTFER